MRADCRNSKRPKVIQDKLSNKTVLHWKKKCLDNKFGKEFKRLKNCKMKCTDDEIDKRFKDAKLSIQIILV